MQKWPIGPQGHESPSAPLVGGGVASMVDGPASTPPSVCGASVTHCGAAAHVEAAAAHDCVADAHDEHWSEHEATAGALETVARWLQMSVHEVLAPAPRAR